jgi:hypothetical protein
MYYNIFIHYTGFERAETRQARNMFTTGAACDKVKLSDCLEHLQN